jgi:hypothetical protein
MFLGRYIDPYGKEWDLYQHCADGFVARYGPHTYERIHWNMGVSAKVSVLAPIIDIVYNRACYCYATRN